MRTIHIQLQPDLQPNLNLEAVRSLMKSVSEHPLIFKFAVTEGFDDGEYINFDFKTRNIASLWAEISFRVYRDSPLAQEIRLASMAVCEGRNGWDDYLQLHHFDPTVPIDKVIDKVIER